MYNSRKMFVRAAIGTDININTMSKQAHGPLAGQKVTFLANKYKQYLCWPALGKCLWRVLV